MSERLFNKNRCKVYVAKMGYRSSDRMFDDLDKAIENVLRLACKRANANGRKTVLEQDI